MKTVRVEFKVKVPETATDKEIEDWISFEIGATCQLAGDNPMSYQDLEAERGTVSAHSY